MTAPRTIASWLNAIASCGVLRVAFDDDALIDAIDLGLVDARPVEVNEDALDCRLTDRGAAALAGQVKPNRMAA